MKIVNVSFCVCVCVCVDGKNPKPPELSPMADNAITQLGIRGLVSLVYICEFLPSLSTKICCIRNLIDYRFLMIYCEIEEKGAKCCIIITVYFWLGLLKFRLPSQSLC